METRQQILDRRNAENEARAAARLEAATLHAARVAAYEAAKAEYQLARDVYLAAYAARSPCVADLEATFNATRETWQAATVAALARD